MPSMRSHSQPGPSLPHHTSNRCSLLYGCHLHCLIVILPRLQRGRKLHKNSRGGQMLSPPKVMGPGVEPGTGPVARPGTMASAKAGTMAAAKAGTVPEAGPGADCKGGRIEGRTELGLLQ